MLTDKSVVNDKVTGLLPTPAKSDCKWTGRLASRVTGKRRNAGLGTYPKPRHPIFTPDMSPCNLSCV
ncbi:hypothetical protein [Burkholderia sp. BCC1977]|uniref:hypothetical protein n=1 Tax=Burkholderia sp. BCC1977 TaxID=2817440 RepID=UPI002ABD4602|nr:hypothetical protein [Burkholderia sp. BCC1977]